MTSRPEGGDVDERFFVTVFARRAGDLRELERFDLDLFQATARHVDQEQTAIEGLLTLEQVAQLVREGYQVLVEDPMERRARAHLATLEPEEWLRTRQEEWLRAQTEE